MEEEYIDIHNTQMQYDRTVARLQSDKQISDRNKQLVLQFVRDGALGKTVINRARKKIGPARLTGYIQQLYPLMLFLNKDLDRVTQDDMEAFIEALDNDQIMKRSPMHRLTPQKLSTRYKTDIKVTVRKYYKWLLGENKTYPPLVEWIDTYIEVKEVPALTEAEVRRLIDQARTCMQRAVIQALFDGGFRIGELLNIRLRHVRLKTLDPADPSQRCYLLRVPFSKTLRRTVVLPMEASKKWLDRWLELHPKRPVVRPDGTLDADDVNAQLFPVSGNAVRLLVNRLGQEALGKRVYPHLLRHTSATYWSNKLPYFKFCKRFGWTMTSNMPQRYIDREGVDELEVATIYHQSVKTEQRGTNSIPADMVADADPDASRQTTDSESRPVASIRSPRRLGPCD